MQYSITNLNTFFIIIAFGYLIRHLSTSITDLSFISQLKGQFFANPVLGLSLAICLFSMAGVPPLVGFFAKYMVLYSAIEKGYYFLALVGIIASVISASYYLRIIRVINFEENKSEKKIHPITITLHSYVIAILTLFILVFILSPSLFLNSSNLLALSLFTV
jgi:NADH-ubiquinone oxidoreductase chain 2